MGLAEGVVALQHSLDVQAAFVWNVWQVSQLRLVQHCQHLLFDVAEQTVIVVKLHEGFLIAQDIVLASAMVVEKLSCTTIKSVTPCDAQVCTDIIKCKLSCA